MAKIALILGSGFSFDAGLPLAKDINKYFIRDNSKNILKFSSGEFMWTDFASETYKHNGRLGFDHLSYGILLNESVAMFIEDKSVFINYEEFYQYIIDNLKSELFIDKLKKRALIEFNKKFPKIKEYNNHIFYTSAITKFQRSEFISLINHLIGDLLYVRIDRNKLANSYATIINYLQEFDSIDIVTLNHDLLMEELIRDYLKKEYSNGFSTNQDILKSSEGKSLNTFMGDFSNKINIFKVHGSIDVYSYVVAEEKGSIVTPTDEVIFFQTHDYDEKQKPIRHDPETGEIVQRFHWAIDPQFITGINKIELLKKPGLYQNLYNESEMRLKDCETLLIIGYSFGDEHINELIERTINESKSLEKIININPSPKFPFETGEIEYLHIESIQELKSLTGNA